MTDSTDADHFNAHVKMVGWSDALLSLIIDDYAFNFINSFSKSSGISRATHFLILNHFLATIFSCFTINNRLIYKVTKRKKLIDRFLSKPKDFSWDELVKVLSSFDYKQVSVGKTAGSRVRFIHLLYPPIILHKPHPKPILKRYQLEDIIELLKQERLL